MTRDRESLTNAVVRALEAGNDAALLAALLELWRACRSPRVANAIERLGQREIGASLTERFKGIGSLNQDKARAAVKRLVGGEEDPRTTVMFVHWLQVAKWPGSGAQEMWSIVFEHLIKLRDSRAIEPLRRCAAPLPSFIGLAHGAWVAARLSATADQLESACADTEDDAEEVSALGALLERVGEGLEDHPATDWFTPPRRKGASADTLKTIEAVWASPDDDDTRRVVADALLDRSDPWGEFIVIQFRIAEKKATAEEKKRAGTLERKHTRLFGGPIAKVVRKESWTFEKGFLVSCAMNRSMVPRRDWEEAARAPHWATVRTMVIDAKNTPKWWITEWVKNPATRNVSAVEVRSQRTTIMRIERELPSGPWRVVSAHSRRSIASAFIAFVKGLTEQERGRVVIEPSVRAREELEAALAKARG